MDGEHPQDDGAAARIADGAARLDRPRLSRRQAIGRMSAVATAGAAAWVVPEILTAKPAAGASLSGSVGTSGTGFSAGVSTRAGTTDPGTGGSGSGSGDTGTGGVATGADATPSTLAFTGLDIKRDAEVGAALVAAGWAMQHWASRRPKLAPVQDGLAEVHDIREAGSPGAPD